MTQGRDRIGEFFDLLDKWRYFPAYQLERRADIFFALYLPQILNSKYGYLIDCIIPEFPLRVGEIHGNELNESFKIDYLCINQTSRRLFLVELKTDIHSRRDKQDFYLGKAKEINTKGLVDGLIKIFKATNQKNKYKNLLRELEQIGWLKFEDKKILNICEPYDISIIYIQPVQHKDDAVEVITFDEIISILNSNTDELSCRFIQSLERWKVNPSFVRPID